MKGFIKDHRKELESDVWSMPPLYHRLWQWLKYNVNHDEVTIPMRDGSHMTIKRGQRLTSVRDIAKGISWYEGTKYKEPNPKTVSTILEWMEKTNMISIVRGQGNRQYTLITLVKYEEYQEKSNQGNTKVTAEKHLADINNNDLNDFNELNISTTTREEFESLEKTHLTIFGGTIIAPMWMNYYQSIRMKGYTDGFINELLLEAAESSNGKVTQRFVDTIFERWHSAGITSRKQAKESKGSSTIGKTGKAAYRPDPELEYRRLEIARNKWISEGNDPNEFVYRQ